MRIPPAQKNCYLPRCWMGPDTFEKSPALFTVVRTLTNLPGISFTIIVMSDSGINKHLNAEHFLVEFN